ncbi:hypothetical protein DFP72DRAFT_1067806 [Ephemerocybe angulata]|uniref:Uncharacterized protein n=1 Tax=Ephemerocybe angulata TaxID=980116 RepID=A0A8H6HY13_9AGAR|nr:hypothetical protein DFP72DRAFT_1067806 [Tulosesus angulatus]
MSAVLVQTTKRALSQSERSLLNVFVTKARYIWTRETTTEVPDGPRGEQRAFRKTFTYPPKQGTPSRLTLFVVGDDYFSLSVDGVLVQPADRGHDWAEITAFNVPLPVVANTSFDAELVIGIRCVNVVAFSGLAVAAQIEYETSATPDIFYTGGDQSWLGEKIFQEQWEQPSFNPNSQAMLAGGATWDPAVVYTKYDVPRDGVVRMPREEIMVFDRLASSGSVPKGGVQAPANANSDGFKIKAGEFVGAMVGCMIVSLALGAFGAWFLLRRNHRATRRSYLGVADRLSYSEPPATTAAQPILSSSYDPVPIPSYQVQPFQTFTQPPRPGKQTVHLRPPHETSTSSNQPPPPFSD